MEKTFLKFTSLEVNDRVPCMWIQLVNLIKSDQLKMVHEQILDTDVPSYEA